LVSSHPIHRVGFKSLGRDLGCGVGFWGMPSATLKYLVASQALQRTSGLGWPI
jgi:hypothetical protein